MHHKRNLSAREIARHTSLHQRTIEKVLKHFAQTGRVARSIEKAPRKKKLDAHDVNVVYQ
jgi:transposase